MSELRVGDKVVIRNHHGRQISLIKRETKTQWITGGAEAEYDRRFRKSDRCEVGCDQWNITKIEPFTKEAEIEIESASLRYRIDRFGDLSKLTVVELRNLWRRVK